MLRLLLLSTLLFLCACQDSANSHSDDRSDISTGVQGRGTETAKWWDALPREAWSAYERVLPDETWFEVYRVLPDIYAIYEPHQFEEVISFLILGQRKALLFDTGLGVARIKPIVDQLTNLEVLVVNSHSHYDHVGGNYEFERIDGLDDPFSRAHMSGRSHDEVREFVSGDWMAKPVPEGIDVSNYHIKPYELASYLDDGSIIDLGGRKLQVLRTPGHTPDSLCLIDRDNRLLLTGDTFYLAPLYAHVKGASYTDYAESVARLAQLAPYVDHLLTAHNVPIASSEYLLKLKLAFDGIDSGELPYERADGAREYTFDGFSILAPLPAP